MLSINSFSLVVSLTVKSTSQHVMYLCVTQQSMKKNYNERWEIICMIYLFQVLLIDSRSFLEFNTSSIQQSVNVCCSKLVKRRLQQNKVSPHRS